MKRGIQLVLVITVAIVFMAFPQPAKAENVESIPQDGLPPKLCLEDLLGMAVELAKAGVQVEFLDINNIFLTVDQLADTTKIVAVYFNGVSGQHLSIVSEYAGVPLNMAKTNSWLKSMTKYQGSGGYGFYLPDFERCFPPSGPQTQEVPAWDPTLLPSWLRDKKSDDLPWASFSPFPLGIVLIFVAVIIVGIVLLGGQKRFA